MMSVVPNLLFDKARIPGQNDHKSLLRLQPWVESQTFLLYNTVKFQNLPEIRRMGLLLFL